MTYFGGSRLPILLSCLLAFLLSCVLVLLLSCFLVFLVFLLCYLLAFLLPRLLAFLLPCFLTSCFHFFFFFSIPICFLVSRRTPSLKNETYISYNIIKQNDIEKPNALYTSDLAYFVIIPGLSFLEGPSTAAFPLSLGLKGR